MNILDIELLTVTYGGIVAIRDVSIRVEGGEAVALLGANGAGKTSCVEAIAGLARKAGGKVRFLGQDIGKMDAAGIARLGLALVPQWRELFSSFTVMETLEAGARAAVGRPPRPFSEIFDLFPVLSQRRNQAAGSLSGGEQQMLAIGRALVGNPKLIMLDEPSAGLAVGVVSTLVRSIQAIRESGIPILIVEQKLDIARAVASRCCVLSAGVLVYQGPLDAKAAELALQQAYFGHSKPPHHQHVQSE